MESLTTSVYECSLPVEAHMICDLLARAGISARVDGEFLAGAGGELPLGNTIKVRVDPSRAAEAREVIAEWDRQNPSDPTPPPIKRAAWRSPLWFAAGAVVGAVAMGRVLRTPATSQEGDTNGDGIPDETYHYNGQVIDRIEYDRNADRKVDERWVYDMNGVASRREVDDNFDGHFEWITRAENGVLVEAVLDDDGNGKPERVQHIAQGIVQTEDIYLADGSRIVARDHLDHRRLVAREYDMDGDGNFERRVEFDAIGDPVPVRP